MKETRKFFDNNHLNKGYSYNTKSLISSIKQQYNYMLPESDIIAEYEELYPGTLEKLLDMAKQEQEHRHEMDKLMLKRHDQAVAMGRVYAMILSALVFAIAGFLTWSGNVMTALLFASLPFGVVITLFRQAKKLSADDYHNKNQSRIPNKNLNRNQKTNSLNNASKAKVKPFA
jgi:uncharacterized membrane protein